jgi:predicted Fe-S protein YdhL (DUF1289 family)
MTTVASPCISVCRMNAQNGLCEGCLRTLDEIAAWSTMDDEGKRAVWASIARRADPHPGPFPGAERKPTGCAAS